MTHMYYILDDDHEVKPVNMEQWTAWICLNDEKRILARTEIGAATVSTVFLGINHNYTLGFLGVNEPMLFETLVFGGPMNDIMFRYTSYDAAMRGHEEACLRVHAAWIDDPGTILT